MSKCKGNLSNSESAACLVCSWHPPPPHPFTTHFLRFDFAIGIYAHRVKFMRSLTSIYCDFFNNVNFIEMQFIIRNVPCFPSLSLKDLLCIGNAEVQDFFHIQWYFNYNNGYLYLYTYSHFYIEKTPKFSGLIWSTCV